MSMKLLVFLLAVLAGVWMWRRGRHKARAARYTGQRAAGNAPVHMVQCTHCGTHVPAHETVAGRKGQAYCSAAHRSASEDAG